MRQIQSNDVVPGFYWVSQTDKVLSNGFPSEEAARSSILAKRMSTCELAEIIPLPQAVQSGI